MRCMVQNCTSDTKRTNRSYGITFHPFPKEVGSRMAWMAALRMTVWEMQHRNMVCSKHFHDKDFFLNKCGQRKIKKGAVPFYTKDSGNDLDSPATLKVCRICLTTDAKLYDITDHNFELLYCQLTGLSIGTDDKLPQMLCWECAHRLTVSNRFRSRALSSHQLMVFALGSEAFFTLRHLKSINRVANGLHTSLVQKVYEPNDCDLAVNESMSIKLERLNDDVTDELTDVCEEEVEMPDLHHDTDEVNESDFMEECADGKMGPPMMMVQVKNERNAVFISEFRNPDNFDSDDNLKLSEVFRKPAKFRRKTKVKRKKPKVEKSRKSGKSGRSKKPEKSQKSGESQTLEYEKLGESGNLEESQNLAESQYLAETQNLAESEKLDECGKLGESEKWEEYVQLEGSEKWDEYEKLEGSDRLEEPENAENGDDADKEHCSDDPSCAVDKYKLADVRRRKINDGLDETLFTISKLNFEEQIQEIAKRQETLNYKDAPFKCNLCFRGFLSKDRYEAHAVRHSDKIGSYECFICKTRLKTTRALRKHVTAQHTEKFSCNGCTFVTKSRGVAREHQRWHAGTKYQCPHCAIEFYKLTTYLGHIRIKHASDCVCELCGYTFVSQKGIEVHKKKKHRVGNVVIPPDGPYCDVCEVRFISEEAYSRHLKLSSKHTSEGDPNRIRNDGQSSNAERGNRVERSTERRPVIHARAPATESAAAGPIACEQCGLEMRDLRLYAQHFRRMHPDKNRTKYPAMRTPCMCEQCGRIFQSMALLKDHMWVHTGEKRFKCSSCDKTFTQKSNLVFHLRAHSSQKQSYECPLCGKKFAFFNNRRRHMFIHTGLKPYRCDTCSKCFTTAGEHRNHVLHVHMKKPWPKRPKAEKDWPIPPE